MANLFFQPKIILFGIILLLSNSIFGQNDDQYSISFKASSYMPPAGCNDFQNKQAIDNSLVNGKFHLLLQFNETPTSQVISALGKQGVQLLNHYGGTAFMAAIPSNFDASNLAQYDLRGISQIPVFGKISTNLYTADYPEWAKNKPGFIDVRISVPYNVDYQYASSQIKAAGYEILDSSLESFKILNARIPEDQLQDIAGEGYVTFVESIEAPLISLNRKNPQATRSSVLRANHPGGLGLTGDGVVVGVGDGGKVTGHIDTEGRIVNLTNDDRASWNNHQNHISGIIGGSDNLDPWFAGIATKVKILAHNSSQIFVNSVDYFNDYGMTLTNNSYGPAGLDCNNFGKYDSSSKILDKNLRENDKLLHVFAAGNSGDDGCNIYPNGHGTIIRSYASSKNTITVGGIYHRGSIAHFSSKGPTKDGRIKPEIVTPSNMVKSTGDSNDYFFASGTSMATAASTGDLALLTEHYKNLNGGQNPRGDLLKAIAANTATDHGLAGPDYSYGFGSLNAKRAADVIKNNQFAFGEISQAGDINHTIAIPSNAHEVKVMLYWHDVEGNPALTNSLVNDLDLVVSSNGLTYQPWVLDHTPANVELPATRKTDNINNIEQVTITGNELNGSQITVNVQGTHITDGPQKYVIVYDIIMHEVTITYPAGGEDFIPNFRKEIIRWDAFGPNADNVKIEYTFDNGNKWTEIPTDADNQEFGYVDWIVPVDANTSAARIRASIVGTSIQHVSNTFQVLPIATGLKAEVICQDQARFSWNAIQGAVEYEILRLDTFMKVIGRTNGKSIVITGLTPNEANYLAVRGVREGGSVGPKGVSKKVIPTGTACASISDVGVAAIVSPVKNGRQHTSISLANQQITIKITNYGNVPASNFPLRFKINDTPSILETFTGTIAPGESAKYTFTSIDPTSLDAVKEYTFNAWTVLSGDAKTDNNSVPKQVVLNQLANPAITTADFPYNINFDQVTTSNNQDDFIGMNGNGIADYNTSALGGRLRVNESSDFNASGSTKAITLDATYPTSGKVTNEMVLTYNLAGLIGNLQELGFQFSYMQHQQDADPTNRVFARGSDTDAWVEVYNLYDNQASSGQYKDVDRMDILPFLTAQGQAVSSSFQLKFSQTGMRGAEDPSGSDGYTFDNIRIDDGVSLPVELAYFDAQKSGNDAILKWSTLTEINNRHFHVEFANGEEGGKIGDWQLLEMVRGAGTTTKPQYYQTIDKRLDKTAYRYYRLRQIDYDGTSVYSDVKVVNFKNAMVEVEVFPNPTVEAVNIKVIGSENSAINIQISDLTGKVFEKIERPASTGEQRIETIKLGERYPEGYYVVSLLVGETTQSYKIYKSAER